MITITNNPARAAALGIAAATVQFTTDATPAVQTTITSTLNGTNGTVASTSGMQKGDFLAIEGGGSGGTTPWVNVINGIAGAVLTLVFPSVRAAVTDAVVKRYERIETRYRADKLILTNLTNGDTHTWDNTMAENTATKVSGGNTTTLTTNAMLNRSNCVAIHPNLLPANSNFTLKCEYSYFTP